MSHDIDLIGYLEERLPPDGMSRVATHLNSCPQCREELALLKKSEDLIGKILTRYPHAFCPETDALIESAAGSAHPEKTLEIDKHLEICPACRRKGAVIREAATEEMEAPIREEWEPLPADLRSRLAVPISSLHERLKEALLALKSKGRSETGDLLSMIDDLADRLMEGGREPAPSYALERNITMPSQTDLKLRFPSVPEIIDFELEDYAIEVRAEHSGKRLKITKEGKPVIGLKIRVFNGEKENIVYTDQAGEACLKDI